MIKNINTFNNYIKYDKATFILLNLVCEWEFWSIKY